MSSTYHCVNICDISRAENLTAGAQIRRVHHLQTEVSMPKYCRTHSFVKSCVCSHWKDAYTTFTLIAVSQTTKKQITC